MKKSIILILWLIQSAILGAQPLESAWLQKNYSKREVMIRMRDGVKLSTAVYEPKGKKEGGAPIIMTRTPYGIKPYGSGFAGDLGSTYKYYALNGYIIVYQSVRGTYLSEGEFVDVRPVGEDPADVNDTYDTIEWLLKHTDNNGRVGVKGVSYAGFYTTVAALCGHQALKAVSTQAPVTDWFIGDDFGHNGELMMVDAYRFGSGFFPPRRRISADGGKTRVAGTRMSKDIYRYFLEKGSLEETFRPWGDSLAFWNGICAHPTYDSWWEARNPLNYLKEKMPAVQVVGGLYDAEDCYGPYATYRALLENSPATEAFLVEGPWSHGGYRKYDYNHLDGAWFGSGISDSYFRDVEYPFFAYYLEGKGSKPAAVTLLPSGETDPEQARDVSVEGKWIRMDRWPSLSGDGAAYRLNFGGKTYISDPSEPVPYFHKLREQDDRDKDYMAGDQRGLESRRDVATWRFEALTDTLCLIGPVKVHLSLRQSCDDADYIVKLIDERPDGYQMLVRGDVMPTRFREGFRQEVKVKPGEAFELDFIMNDIAHFFMPEHRIMIQIQSTWFPLVGIRPATLEKMEVLEGSWLEVPIG